MVRVLQPMVVEQTWTRPGESEPTCLNRKEASPSGNRFDILASIEDDENIANETSADTGAPANPEKNPLVADAT